MNKGMHKVKELVTVFHRNTIRGAKYTNGIPEIKRFSNIRSKHKNCGQLVEQTYGNII